jgi:hypothetical protein
MFIKRILIIWTSVLVLSVTTNPGFGEDNISAEIQDGWIIASQGNDESSQIVKVKVWGANHITGEFYQLDIDPEMEYVVVSRGIGSGPYYKLQIIDFRPNGILTWSYDSSGVPRVENGVIQLGSLPRGYQGAATKPVYDAFSFSVKGLSKIKEE